MCWGGCDICPNGRICSVAFRFPFAFDGTALVGIIYRTFGKMLAFRGYIRLAFVSFAPAFELTLTHVFAFETMSFSFSFQGGCVG